MHVPFSRSILTYLNEKREKKQQRNSDWVFSQERWNMIRNEWENMKLTYNNMRKGSLTYNKEGQVEWDQDHVWHRLNCEQIVQYVPFNKRVSHKALSAWKRHLATKRVTSRQLKFFYPQRGWQIKRFNLVFKV